MGEEMSQSLPIQVINSDGKIDMGEVIYYLQSQSLPIQVINSD